MQFAWWVGHSIAEIAPFRAALGFDDHSVRTISSLRGIVHFAEQALLTLTGLVKLLGMAEAWRRHRAETTILGQPNEIAHLMPLTPAQHPPAAKPTVRPNDDLH